MEQVKEFLCFLFRPVYIYVCRKIYSEFKSRHTVKETLEKLIIPRPHSANTKTMTFSSVFITGAGKIMTSLRVYQRR